MYRGHSDTPAATRDGGTDHLAGDRAVLRLPATRVSRAARTSAFAWRHLGRPHLKTPAEAVIKLTSPTATLAGREGD
jgi:hypothetical protein